ncbi:hypothetical protein ABTM83_20490, partial [Acinetobacter baumannii]
MATPTLVGTENGELQAYTTEDISDWPAQSHGFRLGDDLMILPARRRICDFDFGLLHTCSHQLRLVQLSPEGQV